MTETPQVSFARMGVPKKGTVFVLSAEDAGLGAAAKACDPGGIVERAAAVGGFGAKFGTVLDLLAPQLSLIHIPSPRDPKTSRMPSSA